MNTNAATAGTATNRSERGFALREGLARVMSVYGLVVLLIALIGAFSLLRPDTFPTILTLRGILSTHGVVALLALGVMVPLATRQFDLSIGYVVALTNSLAIGFQIKSGISWEVAALMILAIGFAIGIVNGLVVAYARVDSFIATLGTGTVVFGIANWYTEGSSLSGPLPSSFESLSANWLGIPKVAYYVVAVALVLWIVFEYLPFGRYFYAVGSNTAAAELSGIDVRKRITIAFAISGLLAAASGFLLGSQLQIGQTSTGPEYLLPVFAAVLLGSTTIRPGRVNVWGTVIAVLVLAVAIAGLQQLGLPFYVEYLFNGTMIVLAVGLAGYIGRRRAAGRRAEARAHTVAAEGEPPPGEPPEEMHTTADPGRPRRDEANANHHR